MLSRCIHVKADFSSVIGAKEQLLIRGALLHGLDFPAPVDRDVADCPGATFRLGYLAALLQKLTPREE